MDNETLFVSIVTRHDTAANWAAMNPVLLKGEEGIEIDTGYTRTGDGVKHWNDLPYSNVTRKELKDTLASLALVYKDFLSFATFPANVPSYTFQVSNASRQPNAGEKLFVYWLNTTNGDVWLTLWDVVSSNVNTFSATQNSAKLLTTANGVTVHNNLSERDAADAHPIGAISGLAAALAAEAANRHTEIAAAISEEATDRQSEIDAVNQAVRDEADATNTQLQATNAVLEGVHTETLHGAFLTRNLAIGQNITLVTCALLDDAYSPNTMPWKPGKTLVFDENGTTGVVIACENNKYTILTHAISPLGSDEPTLLGNVDTFADLPTTQSECLTEFGRNAHVDDYARVRHDETLPGTPTTEQYITAIDNDGNVTWGNYIIINTSDYQEQTSADMAGMMLTGGATPGTYGEPIDPSVFVRKGDYLILNGGNASTWSE